MARSSWHRPAAWVVSFLVATTGLLLGQPGSGAAAETTDVPRAYVTGWLPYWLPTTSTASVVAHAQLFDVASPFWFTATSATDIRVQGSSSALTSTVQALRTAGVPVVPTVNSDLTADQFAAILANRTARTAHVEALAATAERYGVQGLDLDYESVNFGGSSAKDTVHRLFPVLAAELDARLARDGRISAVTVPARRGDADPNWRVYDYARLGAAADRFRIMTYDYSWSGGPAGPIAPVDWVEEVVAYAVTRVDPLKVSLGVPAYGRDWFTRTLSGSCPASAKAALSRTTAQMVDFAAARGITPTWDSVSASRTFTYRQSYTSASGTCTAKRTVWFDDARSLAAKLELVARYRIQGVAVWAFGGETPAFWDRMSDFAARHPQAPTTVEARASASVAFGQVARVRGVVHTASGPVAGAAVTLQRRPLTGGSWRAVATQVSTTDGVVAFAVRPTRHSRFRLVAAPTWTTTASTSAAVVTRVRYAVTFDEGVPLRLAPRAYLLAGSVGPQLVGVTVVKQRFVDGAWVDRGSTVVDASGAFRFELRGRAGSSRTLRAVARGTGLDEGWSDPVTVTFG